MTDRLLDAIAPDLRAATKAYLTSQNAAAFEPGDAAHSPKPTQRPIFAARRIGQACLPKGLSRAEAATT